MDIELQLKRIFLTNPVLVALKSELYKQQFKCRVSECSDLEKYVNKNADFLLPEDRLSSHLLWMRCAEECSQNIRLAQKFQTLMYQEVKSEMKQFFQECKGDECVKKGEEKLMNEIKPMIETQLKDYFESKLKN